MINKPLGLLLLLGATPFVVIFGGAALLAIGVAYVGYRLINT